MTGRPLKPTALKLIDGTFRPDRHGPPSAEPQPEGTPDKPKWLKGRASKVWDQYAPELIRLKVLTSVDGHSFGLWCQLAAKVERKDYTAAEIAQFRMIGSEFGIGAASRARLGTRDDKETKDPAAKYLR